MIVQYKRHVNRLTSILELLVDQNRSLTIGAIAALNGCTDRTIYNDISYLVEHWNHLLHLDISHNRLFSHNTSIANIQYVAEQIYMQEPLTVLMKLILETPNQTLEYYASALDLSHQTTRNLLVELRNALASFGIELKLRSRQICVKGDEFTVRYCFAVCLYLLEHAFPLRELDLNLSTRVEQYMNGHSLLSGFMRFIISVTVYRYRSGFRMRTSNNLEEDVEEVLSHFISLIEDKCEILQTLEAPLFAIFKEMGYHPNAQERQKLLVMYASILLMEQRVLANYETRVMSIHLFMRHYRKVHPYRLKRAELLLLRLLADFEGDKQQIMGGMIYFMDAMCPLEVDDDVLDIMVYSNTSLEHGFGIKRQLERSFRNHRFHVYDLEQDYYIPSKEGIDLFCESRQCQGIVSTLRFPFLTALPLVSVNDCFSGFDVGQVFDFINGLNPHK